jgi:hypothetical protein
MEKRIITLFEDNIAAAGIRLADEELTRLRDGGLKADAPENVPVPPTDQVLSVCQIALTGSYVTFRPFRSTQDSAIRYSDTF